MASPTTSPSAISRVCIADLPIEDSIWELCDHQLFGLVKVTGVVSSCSSVSFTYRRGELEAGSLDCTCTPRWATFVHTYGPRAIVAGDGRLPQTGSVLSGAPCLGFCAVPDPAEDSEEGGTVHVLCSGARAATFTHRDLVSRPYQLLTLRAEGEAPETPTINSERARLMPSAELQVLLVDEMAGSAHSPVDVGDMVEVTGTFNLSFEPTIDGAVGALGRVIEANFIRSYRWVAS